MARRFGETLARLVDRRIGEPVNDAAAMRAIATDDPRRINGCVTIKLDDGTSWIFNITSAAPAGPGVLVPDAGTGRWLAGAGAAAGAGLPGVKSVRARTTGALPANTRVGNVLTANGNGALGAQDGTALAVADRLLVMNEGTGANNGPYQVTDLGSGGTPWILTRIGDADASAEVVAGMFVFVGEGTSFGDEWAFLSTNDPIVLNTTALVFEMLPDLTDMTSADTSLTTRVSAEESTRGSADTSLTTRLSTEESTRGSADTSLTARVSTEESTRGSADTSLTARVSSAESVETSTTTSLTTRVSTEESTRASADTSLTARVSTEESTRASADTSLTARVSTEESTRASADTSLTARVSTEESTRASADTSLDTRVDVLAVKSVQFSLFEMREVDANGDVGATVVGGGVLAADTTPILEGATNERQQIRWVATNVDIIAAHATLPADFNGALDATLRLWVSSGLGGPDAATFTVETGWDGAALVTDTATDGAPGVGIHEITATIAAADIPDAPDYLVVYLTPAAHALDPIQLHAARLEYTSTAGA